MDKSEYVFLTRISAVDSIDALILTFESIWKEIILIDLSITNAKIRFRKNFKDIKIKKVEINFTQLENIFLKRNVIFIDDLDKFITYQISSEENFKLVVFPIIIQKSLKNLIVVKPIFKKETFSLAGNIILNQMQKFSLINLVEKSKIYFETIFNNINSLIIITDKNKNILFSNNEKPNIYKCYELAFQKDYPCEFCFKDNSTKTVKINNNHFEIQHILFEKKIVCIIKDITNFVKLKQELLKSQQLSLLGKFSAEIAHEIKNPLNSIKLKLELLKRKINNVREINDIEKEIIRLSQIASEFLQLGKTVNLSIEKINLFNFFKEIQDIYLNKIKLSFICKNNIEINGDKNKLLQVFINIINNSIEAKATEIEIICKQLNEKVEISIIDNGNGVKNPDNLFTPFYSEKEFGSGLGLIISKKIIEAHKGNLFFVKDNKKKTEFRIVLPQKI